MIEQEVNLTSATTHDDLSLLSHKGKAVTHLQKHDCDVLGKGSLQFCLVVDFVIDCCKAEIVVLFQDFLNQFALKGWQMVSEVVDNLSLMLKEVSLDAVNEGITA